MSETGDPQNLIRFLKGLRLVQLFLGYVFVINGLFVNFLQFLSACLIWPWNRSLYRKINYHLATLIWSRKCFTKAKKKAFFLIKNVFN